MDEDDAQEPPTRHASTSSLGTSFGSASQLTVSRVLPSVGLHSTVTTWWQSLRSLCCSLLTCVCFAIAYLLLPAFFVIQMGIWDMIILREYETWCFVIFVVLEVGLLGNMMCRNLSSNGVRGGCFQWIVYSWLLSAKCAILYFEVLPEMPYDEVAAGSDGLEPLGGVEDEDRCHLFSCRNDVTTLLYITPVFYMGLTGRTLRELFRSDEGLEPGTGGSSSRRQSDAKFRGRHQERAALDVILLTDMVWHVVIDMIDIIHMVKLPESQDPADRITMGVLDQHPGANASIRKMIGAFVCLAFFFHQQSFPRAGYRVLSGEAASHRDRVSADTHGHSPNQRLQHKERHGHHDYYVDVVKARKRSAIVSILLVDMPFLVVRTFVLFLSRPEQLSTFPSTNTTSFQDSLKYGLLHARPQVDKWLVKNVLCMLLQAMQLRFVQQADMERSQVMKWWDVRRSASRTGVLSRKGRDKDLLQKWQMLDQKKAEDKAEAAFRDSGVGPLDLLPQEESRRSRGDGSPVSSRVSSRGDSSPISTALVAPHRFGGSVLDPTPEEGQSPKDACEPQPRSSFHRCCCCCCCGRRATQQKEGRSCRRRCCCRCCELSLLTHVIMGAFLGWLMAKVDFEQNINDLYVIVGRSAQAG